MSLTAIEQITASPSAPTQSALAQAGPARLSSEQQNARIEETAKEFEALIIAQLLQPLFSSVETPGLAGGGPGQEAFESLLQEQYASAIAERGGFGIADQVKAALIDLQSSPLRQLS
ncbi:MAG: rod-binding protein [Pseudomonadota bacterium]